MRALAVVALAALTGCAAPNIITHPQMRMVELDGMRIWVSPMERPDTWGATRYSITPLVMPNPGTEKALLTRAIEQVTKCKVESSHYHLTMQNLYANVRC
jgi:hypothetical protein